MQHLSLTLPTLPENLALDEALLLEAEDGRSDEILRFWQWPSWAVVLGAGGVVSDDVESEACEKDGVPIFRRSSGGGTVLLGPGCFLFTLVLNMERRPELQQIGSSYRFILTRVAASLRDLESNIELAGTSDLAILGRKFSGNSQQRKRRVLMHHGTILHGMDFSQVSRYLQLPPRQPDYRGRRAHEEFLMNLRLETSEIQSRIRSVWQATVERHDWPQERVAQLTHERFGQRDWINRR
ncbi:MAG TPA: lipoate--protein ligase family protein [Gemmataceae bacterium]|nr:lipoate--protein ligase family protein [Gemmataceae bacterium]